MANPEHLDILRQGVEVWKKWGETHSDVIPDFSDANLCAVDLSSADLSGADLSFANLSGAKLSGTDLSGAKLSGAELKHANLSDAKLNDANFSFANFSFANLSFANLSDANLSDANLSDAKLNDANFSFANFSFANLSFANLSDANLSDANLSHTIVGQTIFGDLDLHTAKGLETIQHAVPSTIGIDTIYRSGGNIPEAFLRGAGVPDTFITYARSLVGKPIEFYSCFISYSSKDQEFAQRLHNDLQGNGVRCWFAPEDLKIGDKFRMRIDESIRLYDKLLLVLSENSLASNWVTYEVEKALNKEPEGVPNVLFPIRLDKTILTCENDWAKDIRKSRHIGDFEHWKDHDAYQRAFQRLLRDLKAQS